jgi:multicomponent Na+:H+ antiporter subunit F
VNILAVTMVAILVCMCLTLVRLLLGPTVFDRLLAANSFGTKTVLLLALIGFLFDRPHFLDLAIIYALINFVGVVAALRFVKARKESQPEQPIQ